MPTTRFPLITPEQAAALPPGKVFWCDVRHDLFKPSAGLEAWQAGHIPGAVHVSVDSVLGGRHTGRNGRHPLPSQLAFLAALSELGWQAGQPVIAYDAQGGQFAARLWWMLRAAGHETVQVLDGGWQAWQAAGLPISTEGPVRVLSHPPANTLAEAGDWQGMPRVEADALLQTPVRHARILVDARAPARWRGDEEPLDPVGGHIPGALNRPFALNLDATGRFKPARELRAEFEALLAGQAPAVMVHSCGSGVSACHNLLAMHAAGLEGASLYPGSWSEWCSDPARPVARGDQP